MQIPRPPSNARPTRLPSTWGLALRLRLTYKYIDSGICVSGPGSLAPGCKYRRTCTHLKMTIGFGREKCAKVLHKSRQFSAKMSVTGELKLAIYALSDLPSVMTTSPLPTPPLHSFSKLPLDLVELLQAERFALTKLLLQNLSYSMQGAEPRQRSWPVPLLLEAKRSAMYQSKLRLIKR